MSRTWLTCRVTDVVQQQDAHLRGVVWIFGALHRYRGQPLWGLDSSKVIAGLKSHAVTGRKACWGVKVSGWGRKCSKGQWKGRANNWSEAIWRDPSNPNCHIEVSQREVKTERCEQVVGFARQLLPITVVARWGDPLSTPPPPVEICKTDRRREQPLLRWSQRPLAMRCAGPSFDELKAHEPRLHDGKKVSLQTVRFPARQSSPTRTSGDHSRMLTSATILGLLAGTAVAETVHGAVVFTRHGDRESSSSPSPP